MSDEKSLDALKKELKGLEARSVRKAVRRASKMVVAKRKPTDITFAEIWHLQDTIPPWLPLEQAIAMLQKWKEEQGREEA